MEDLFKCPLCEVVCVNKNSLLAHVDKHIGFPLSCIICHSTFKNQFSFDYHLVSELCKKIKKHVGQYEQCPQRPQTFPNRGHLDKHVENHRRNNCQYCEARFTTRKELTLHMAQEHQMKLQKAKYQCQFCERCFVKQVTLFNHYNQHANGKFVCQGCGLFLDTKEEFEIHRDRHEQERPWKCTRCATTFSRRQQYVVHMESHEKYQCKTCNMGFAAKATLQEHNRACQNQSGTESLHECPECGKIFCRQGQLKLHLKAHTGEEAYTCSVCKKSLQTAEEYNEHIQSACSRTPEDDQKKLHNCQQCDRRFTHGYLLEEHMNQVHNTVRCYKCAFCDHSSNSRSNMIRHLALHTEKRRFSCDQCGAAFHALTTLKDHCNSIHSHQRHFSCTTCSKTFKLQSDLKRHIHSHSDMRLFKCHYCNQAYKRASHLRRHEESAHGTIFKPRRLQRLGHDETGALVPIVKESKSSAADGVKEEPPVVPPDQKWTSPATSQASVYTNPVLSLVDANLGEVITLQEVCTVSDAQILTATSDLTSEVLNLPRDDALTAIVACTDGTALDSFQSGELINTIQMTYDLSFPSQTLTTVLSSSEPQLVFAAPITMSLDQNQAVLTVSEIYSGDNMNGKVQLLDAHATSDLPDTIFIDKGKLGDMAEPMLLDGIEPVPHMTVENFSMQDDRVLQTTTGSALTLSELPNSVETILQLHPEQPAVSTDSPTVPDNGVSGSLLRERLISGPKLKSPTLPSVPVVLSQCGDDLDTTIMSSIPIPSSMSGRSTQPDSNMPTLFISSPDPSTSIDGPHLDSLLSISNGVKQSYASISIENIDADSVRTSYSVPNSIQLPCTDMSSDGMYTESSVPQLSATGTVLSPSKGVPLNSTPCISVCVTDPTASSANTNHDSSVSALTVSDASETTRSDIPAKGDDLVHPLCPSMPEKKSDSESISTLSVTNCTHSSHSDIDYIHMNTIASAPSLHSVNISEPDTHPIETNDANTSIEDTHTDFVLTSLPITSEDLHSSSSLSNSVHFSCSDKPTNANPNLMPDFVPQNFPFLNVE